MQDQRENKLAVRATITATATIGAILGFWLGCGLAIPLAEDQLHKYMERAAAQRAASLDEARTLLDSLQHSANPPCSDAELGLFRDLIFRSDYLKDAGRIHGGRIECSATAGRPLHPMGHFVAGSTSAEAAAALNGLVPISDRSLNMSGIEEGSLFVLFGSHLPVVVDSLPVHLEAEPIQATALGSIQDASLQSTPGEGGDSVTRDGNMLVAMQCSQVFPSCVKASIGVDEARHGEAAYVAGASVLGGIAGAWFGILLCFLRRRSLSLDQQLKRAVARDNLQLEYQPIVNLANGKIVGAEALARWTNQEGVAVSPDIFIKAAEDNGFVGSITTLVLKRALKEFRDVLRTFPGFRLSINVAPSDLVDPLFLPKVNEAVEKANIPTSSLAFEVTERSAATDQDALQTIRELRDRGYKIYIDDFGTGYSNLSYLLYLSVDTIKIDKAFVRAIGTESPSVAILPQILAMARTLNLGVVAEGIEVESQANYFPMQNIRIYGQGWFYGRPMPALEFSRLVGLAGDPSATRAGAESTSPWPQLVEGASIEIAS